MKSNQFGSAFFSVSRLSFFFSLMYRTTNSLHFFHHTSKHIDNKISIIKKEVKGIKLVLGMGSGREKNIETISRSVLEEEK